MKVAALKNKNDAIALLALDNSLKLAELLSLDLSLENNELLLKQLNQHLMKSLGDSASGVVLDPVYTLALLANKNKNTGVVLRLNNLAETDPLALPSLIPNWSAEEIKNNYGVAKLELYYHPNEDKALEKKQLVAEVYDYCQLLKIDLLLDLKIFSFADEKVDPLNFSQTQLQAVEELRSSCDLLALQYPLEPLAAATITASLDIPWIVNLSAGDYQTNKNNLRVCLENGAAGFVAGETLFDGIENERNKEDQSLDLNHLFFYIQTNVRDRFLELIRITNEEVMAKNLL